MKRLLRTGLLCALIAAGTGGCGKKAPVEAEVGGLPALQQMAAQGNADAQYLLGHLHYFGSGIPSAYRDVMEWCRLAADNDYRSARERLGAKFPDGVSVRQDCGEAVKWFRAAAAQGHTGAVMMVGTACFMGLGVPENEKEAVRWFRQAAEKGNAGAQTMMGKCFYFGNGVEQDPVQAYAWFRLAAQNGFSKAAEDLTLCTQKLTPEQIEAGSRLAAELTGQFSL